MPRTSVVLSLLALLSAPLLGTGCNRAVPYRPGSPWSAPSSPAPTPPAATPSGPEPVRPVFDGDLRLANGSQAGDMGEIRGFDGAVTRYEGRYDPYGTSIRLDSEGPGWWAMSALYITGDLASDAFAPGVRRTFASSTYGPSSVSVTGCSGPTYGNYTYDHGADEVTVDVEALPNGTRRMHVEATYTAYDGTRQVTTASFDYSLPGTGGPTASGTTASFEWVGLDVAHPTRDLGI